MKISQNFVRLRGNTPFKNINMVTTGNMKAATYNVGATAGIDATVTYVDTLLGARTLTFSKGILTSQA